MPIVQAVSRPARVTRSTLFLCSLALSACQGGVQAVPVASAEPAVVGGVTLDVDDEISALDATLDTAGHLHVAWVEDIAPAPGALPQPRLRHAALGREGWSPPRTVGEESGPVHLLALGDGIHLIAGPRLRHRVSRDGGRSWSDRGELVPTEQRGRVFSAALGTPEGLVVAWWLHPRTPWETEMRDASHRQRLYVLDLRRPTAGPQVAADVEPSMAPPAAPSLAVAAGRLHLATALNLERPVGGAGGTGVVARIVHLAEDGRGGWSPPVDVLPGDGLLNRDVRAVDLAADDGSLLCAWSAYGVYLSTSADGAEWSTPHHVNPYDTQASLGQLLSGDVTLTTANAARLTWIDGRYTRSDRRWWNPLGGLPWSDDLPFWANRDVFTQAAEAAASSPPSRLTLPLSSAEHLASA
jgi:hypothetical protein